MSTATNQAAATAAEAHSSARIASLTLLIAAVAALESIIVPALPLVQREFGVDADVGALASVALTLSTVLITPIAGRIADIYGARPTLIWLTVVVVFGGSLSALANVFPLFVAGQFLQGFGLGLLPVSFVVLRTTLTPDRVKTATGFLGAVVVGGGALGVVLAGPMADKLSRSAMYAVPTGLVLLGTLAFSVVTPKSVTQAAGGRVDWLGALGLAAGLLTMTAWLSSASSKGWMAPPALALALITLAVLMLWARYQRRTTDPMVDLSMMTLRPMWTAVAVGVVFGFTYGAVVYLIPQQLAAPAESGFGLGASTTTIGLLLCVGYGAAIAASVISGILTKSRGTTPVAAVGVGMLGASAALGAVSTQLWQIVLALILAGVGIAAASTAVFVVAANSAAEERVGVTTAIATIARSLGAAVGTQIAAGILAGTEQIQGYPEHAAFSYAFAIAAAVAVVGLVVTALMPRGESH
ncbi:MFS transporter [Rhodococcus sp. ACT016]|uniref:MFS transporter n=1 Tax=Rhodococcus sp. ACT016 TaxID=3134808 RepID=UPI003D271062